MQPAAELIKEIALLEMEVVHLEQYLLSLYRAAFNHHQGALPSAVMDRGPGSLLHDTKLQTTDQKNSTVQSTQQCVHNGTSSVTNQTSSFEDFEKQRESEIQHVQNYGDQCSADSDHCIFPPRENHKSVSRHHSDILIFPYMQISFSFHLFHHRIDWKLLSCQQ